MKQIALDVLPKQFEFLTATDREVMYSGAVRAGKTYALCLHTAMRASQPKAREILVRKTLAALKGTTLKTLLEGDGFNPPILPDGTYTHNKADKEIRLVNGGSILYFALVNDGAEGTQQRAGSYSGTGVNIDECTELDEADYRMLLSRASIPHPDVPLQVAMACNPGSPSHFLAKRFAPPGSGYSTPRPGCRCISTRTDENHFLPKDYLEGLEADRGTLWYRRFVEGLWCGAEGVVYDKWDRQVHVRQRPLSDFGEFVIGIDQGYDHPFAALLVGIDGDGRTHVLTERYGSKWVIDDKVKHARDLMGIAGKLPYAAVVDPSAAELIASLRLAGVTTYPANNDVIPGINTVQQQLIIRGDGLPGMTVDPSCENTIREFETYQWKPDRPKDEVVKKHDDAMDALRYAQMRIHGGVKFGVSSPGASKPGVQWSFAVAARPALDDDDRGWRKWE